MQLQRKMHVRLNFCAKSASNSRRTCANSYKFRSKRNGNRVSEQISDANNHIAYATSRAINSLNRVSSITSGQGSAQGTTQYGVDANGQAVSQTDPLNHTTTQTLDGLRRPTATTLPDNSS
ncbi:MAG: RHS repeat domain-containing protein, partial [Rhodoferax sp.]